jgi:hypothetical protein
MLGEGWIGGHKILRRPAGVVLLIHAVIAHQHHILHRRRAPVFIGIG